MYGDILGTAPLYTVHYHSQGTLLVNCVAETKQQTSIAPILQANTAFLTFRLWHAYTAVRGLVALYSMHATLTAINHAVFHPRNTMALTS